MKRQDVQSDDELIPAFRLVLLHQFLLRPMLIIYLVSTCVYFFKTKWLIGAVFLFALLFLMFLIKWLQWTISIEAYDGPPAEEENDDLPEGFHPMSYEEASIISKTLNPVGFVLGLTTLLLSIHYGMRIYLAILLGIITTWLGVYVVGKGFIAYCVFFEIQNTNIDEKEY